MRSRKWFALACLFILTVPGCTTHRAVRLRGEIDRPDAPIQWPGGQRVVGYTDARGNYYEFDGQVRVLPRGFVEFYTLPMNWRFGREAFGNDTPLRSVVLPRDSVETIFVQRTAVAKTVVAVIGTTILAAAVVVLASSCPFIYSWDGQRYVFDGEPYGGATMQALERTDWSELEHLAASGGHYRLMLTNEMDETQHTNRLALLAIEHPPGTKVVMDREGRAHAFRELAPLTSAVDETGRDLLPWLRETDRAAWYPDLGASARADSLADTRNHLTLEFARPPGVTRAFLVSNAATGQWGSHMLRTMLGLRGDRVQEFYAAINGSALYRQQLLEWNRREELFELFFEVRQGDQWVRSDFIPGGGPFISENRAIPVDLTGVIGDRVEIRLHPPVGFWSLNSFHLAWEEAEATVTELLPESASGMGGAEAVNTLRAADSLYLDFPNEDARNELVFPAPPTRPGMERTVFAETRGWYEVHLYDLGAPDVTALNRLTFEPGFVVRRALREYAEYQRTGVLQGVPAVPAGAGGR